MNRESCEPIRMSDTEYARMEGAATRAWINRMGPNGISENDQRILDSLKNDPTSLPITEGTEVGTGDGGAIEHEIFSR